MTSQHWAVLFAAATLIAVLTGVLAWRRRHRTPAAVALVVTMSGHVEHQPADRIGAAGAVVEEGVPRGVPRHRLILDERVDEAVERLARDVVA